MSLEQTWRWFGPRDPIRLSDIRQTGATGIVTALHQIPVGEIWGEDDIRARQRMIEAAGLSWSVVESLPVHENIKKRQGNFRQLIDHYRISLANLGACGIDTVCYNFMPVLDWSRTNLGLRAADGSLASGFDPVAMAVFDLFLLKRPHAEGDYSPEQIAAARAWLDASSQTERDHLVEAILMGLPGSGEAFTTEVLLTELSQYREIGAETLRENLFAFIAEVLPAAMEAGINLAIHPDDPPMPLLGLPRIVSTKSDLSRFLEANPETANGLTYCTGSLGAGRYNDVVDMAGSFADRIHFIHLRNVRRDGRGGFTEVNHLEGDGDLYRVMSILVEEQERRIAAGRPDRRMPMRPDHGPLMQVDSERGHFYPGYSLLGRMKALAELRGLEVAIRRAGNRG